MPEPDDQGLKPEHLAGAAVGALPIASLLTQRANLDFKGAPNLQAKELQKAIRPGDVILSKGNQRYSGFRTLSNMFLGSPYYHGDSVYSTPKGNLRMQIPGYDKHGKPFKDWIGDREGAVVLRHKDLQQSPEMLERLRTLNKQMGAKTYSTTKIPIVGLGTSFMPRAKALEGLPQVHCNGEVCTTGPAAILRNAGLNLGMKTIPGTESAVDYLSNPNFKAVATYGSRPSGSLFRHALPGRLATGALAGLGAYKLVKDMREGDYAAPPAAAAGALGGALLGSQIDNMSTNAYVDADKTRKILMNRFKYVMPKATARSAARGGVKALTTLSRGALWPTALGAVAGGVGAHMLATKLQHLLRGNQPERRAAIS